MASMRDIVDAIPSRDLKNKSLCYRCLYADLPVQDSLYYPCDMKISPETGDSICIHCHDDEVILGYTKLSKHERKTIENIIKRFEKYKDQRINNQD